MSTHLDDLVIGNPGALIRRAHQISVSIFLAECSSFGVTPLQYEILQRTRDHSGLDQTTVAQSVGLDRTTTARIARNLAERGLLLRQTDPKDRRTKRLTVTPKGRALLNAIETVIEHARGRIIAPLDESEKREFLRLLAKLVEGNNEHSRAPVADLRAAGLLGKE